MIQRNEYDTVPLRIVRDTEELITALPIPRVIMGLFMAVNKYYHARPELRIKPDMAVLLLDMQRAAYARCDHVALLRRAIDQVVVSRAGADLQVANMLNAAKRAVREQ